MGAEQIRENCGGKIVVGKLWRENMESDLKTLASVRVENKNENERNENERNENERTECSELD